MKKTTTKRALTIQEAADYACVCRSTVENWLKRGLLPYEELPNGGGGKYHFRRIRMSDLDEFLDRNRKNQKVEKKVVRMPDGKVFLLPKTA